MHDGTPKPAYYAYQTMTSIMAEARYSRTLSAADVGLSGATADAFEGYAFRTLSGRKDIWVVWLNSDGSATISVPAASLTVIDKLGQRSQVLAGPGGTASVHLTASPIYLEMPR